MDKETQQKLALAILPHLDAIHKTLGLTTRISLVAVLNDPATGEGSDLVILGNGDFVESAYVLLRSEMTRSAENVISITNDNTKH